MWLVHFHSRSPHHNSAQRPHPNPGILLYMIRALAYSLILAGIAASAVAADPTSPVQSAVPAVATQPAGVKFLRYVDSGPEGSQLQAAEVTYRNAEGVSVRLVSAVHIGEESYYQSIAKRFENDEVVLYEMVKPRGMPAPQKGQHSDHAVSQLQRFLKDKLNLAYQLDAIDYTRPNFVHADLDAETFEQLQSDRHESMASLMLQSMASALTNPPAGTSGDGATDLLTMLAQPDPERQMKLVLAQQFDNVEAAAMGLDGPNGSVILSERNKAVISVLNDTIASGKKQIAIFYGAAHMPDLARRIEALGFKPVSTTWYMAWDVTIRKDEPSMLVRWFGAASQPTTAPAP